MTMNIFLSNAIYFAKQEKAIVLNYDVINGVTMMQYIYQKIKYFIPAED